MTPQQKAQLESRLADFSEFVDDAPFCIQQLLDHYGVATKSDANALDQYLVLLDRALQQIDFENMSDKNIVWLEARVMYFVGEWLIYRFGGRWIVQSDTESQFFAHYAISFFERDFPEEAVISPGMVASSFLRTSPGRSLVDELVGLVEEGRSYKQILSITQRMDVQIEEARLAVLEERTQGTTNRRCPQCGETYVCKEEGPAGQGIYYRIGCKCFTVNLYDLERPVIATHRNIVIGE